MKKKKRKKKNWN